MTTIRLLTLTILATVTLLGPTLFVAAVSNLAVVSLVKAEPCAPRAFPCQTGARAYLPMARGAGQRMLNRLGDGLAWAFRFAPWNEGLRMHLAEVQFALGRRDQAAALLPLVPLTLPDVQEGAFPLVFRSRLLTPGRYENYLIAAYQQATAGRWEAAIVAFRLALSLGAEYLTPADHRAYFAALAQHYALQVEQVRNPQSAIRNSVLAGKYFALAGKWADAEVWLRRAQEMVGWDELVPEEQARAWIYLGLVREQAGNLAEARLAYERAVALAPTLAEPRIRLLALLHQLGDRVAASRVAAALARRGPTYRLGTFGPGYVKPNPVTLPSEWTLVGYDVDEESLEAGGLIDLWLWWQAPPGGQPTGGDWLPVSDYWLQRQEVVNLAPNPGFAWGMAADGLPLGFFAVYHTGASQGISIVDNPGPRGGSPMLRINNQGVLGIKSFPIPVDGHGLYLTAAWLKQKGGRAVLGRQCFPAGHPADQWNQLWGRPIGLTWEIALEGKELAQMWVHVAHLGPPHPDRLVTLCQVYLGQRSGSVMFDGVLFAKLSVP